MLPLQLLQALKLQELLSLLRMSYTLPPIYSQNNFHSIFLIKTSGLRGCKRNTSCTLLWLQFPYIVSLNVKRYIWQMYTISIVWKMLYLLTKVYNLCSKRMRSVWCARPVGSTLFGHCRQIVVGLGVHFGTHLSVHIIVFG